MINVCHPNIQGRDQSLIALFPGRLAQWLLVCWPVGVGGEISPHGAWVKQSKGMSKDILCNTVLRHIDVAYTWPDQQSTKLGETVRIKDHHAGACTCWGHEVLGLLNSTLTLPLVLTEQRNKYTVRVTAPNTVLISPSLAKNPKRQGLRSMQSG